MVTVIMAAVTVGSVFVLVRVMMMMPVVTVMPVVVMAMIRIMMMMIMIAVQEVILHALDARNMQLANRLVTVCPSPERLRTPFPRILRHAQQLVVFDVSFQMNLDVGDKKAVRLSNWTVTSQPSASTQ